jgi:hypothetical protein
MKTVHVVEVQTGRMPLLPNICVVCGKAGLDPLDTIQMSDENGRVDFYLYGIAKEPAVGPLLPVPVHPACARTVRNAALTRLLAIAIAWAIIGTGATMLGLDAFLAFAAATIPAGPLLYLEFTRPVPLEFWFSGGKYCLAFSNGKLAHRVARLNGAELSERTLSSERLTPRGRASDISDPKA